MRIRQVRSLPVVGVAAATRLLLLASPVAAQGWFPPDSSIRAMLADAVARGRTVGVVVGLLDSDGSRRVFARGSGGQDAPPLTRESVFEIGSITKVFTGILLADMVRRGEVELTEPISNLLPAEVRVPSRNGKPITLLDIATHYSGLPKAPTNIGPQDPYDQDIHYTLQQAFDFLSGYELHSAPGERFEYSNYAMGLLGYALSLRAGVDYDTLLFERVLRPLGLSHTAARLTPWMRDHLTRGHDAFGELVPNRNFPVSLAGAAGLRSTADDLLDFAAANLWPADTGLGPALRVAYRPLRYRYGRTTIGLNWFIDQRMERVITWHGGRTRGYVTFIGLDLEANRAVVVLTNSGGYGLEDLGFHLLDPAVPLEQTPVGPAIAHTYRASGIEAAIERYRSLRETARDRYRFDVGQLNRLGYWLLMQGLIDDAIEVFRLNVEVFPDSPDPHNSLGDALTVGGWLEEAKRCYERAIELAALQGHPDLAAYRRNLEELLQRIEK